MKKMKSKRLKLSSSGIYNLNYPFSITRKLIFIFFLITGCTVNLFSQSQSKTLSGKKNSSWQFRKAGDKKWLTATVPGTVHTDLLDNKIIDDPFYGDNENKLRWIDTCDWEYQTFFTCDSAMFNSKHVKLRFEGLDTYAKVYLNDALILITDNMFRTWEVDCKEFIKEEGNHLFIRFESAEKKGKELSNKLPYHLPDEERIFTRKAAYQYGWDWAPRFLTCGIWRPVTILSWNTFEINSINFIQDYLSDTAAYLVAEVNIKTDQATTVYFKMLREDQLLDSVYFEQTIRPGENTLNLPFTIKNPKRWWCNGMGDPYLYRISLQASNAYGKSEIKKFAIGLRTVQVIQEADTAGKSFYFKLNGVPVFMKGANYVPADNFLPRITEDRYREIIQSSVDANMNMLRVWGGGTYEDDQFYNFCDEKGIMVWQDFMFAGAMYPGDSLFLENVKQEAVDNVIRLRNHPSIALWCGNNEIDEGWNNWEWQKKYKYSVRDSAKIWKDYQKLFEDILPKVVEQNDPAHFYWPSSPLFGWGHPESLIQGDSHYWGVWWGMEPFAAYKNKVGRFMSEYGFQAMPSLNSFAKFCDQKNLSLNSDVVKSHQKHPAGFETIGKYLERDYKQPKDFESYSYTSQVLQSEGIKIAIEAHRRAKPFCMGSLYWQLNDCWPVTSWSSIDYYGTWKASHYAAKKAFQNYLVSPVFEDKKLKVYVVSDNKTATTAMLEMKTLDFSGTVQWSKEIPVTVFPDSGRICFSVDSTEVLKNIDPEKSVFSVKLKKGNTVLSENMIYFRNAKELKLAPPQIQYLFSVSGKSITLELESKSLAKNVFIDFGDMNVKLSDNFFDLIPGDKKMIAIGNIDNVESLKKMIKVKSLFDSY
jgi:beta-mannosidase